MAYWSAGPKDPCRVQPVQLLHDYSKLNFGNRVNGQADFNTIALPLVTCVKRESKETYEIDVSNNPTFCLIHAVMQLAQILGSTEQSIVSKARVLDPSYSETDYTQAFSDGLKSGIFVRLAPVRSSVLATPDPATYTINPRLDEKNKHAKYIKYMLLLIGGLKSHHFTRWFRLPKSIAQPK